MAATSLARFVAGIGIGRRLGARRGGREAEQPRREAGRIRRTTAAREAEADRRQAELDARMEQPGLQ